MKNPQTIATLDGAVGHLRDQIENLEEVVRSESVDPSHRTVLAFHVDALLEAQDVLEQEVTILGMPAIEVAEEVTVAENDIEGAFAHLCDQVDNLEEAIGSSAVQPTDRGILALQLDAIREAFTVLENETKKVDRKQGEAATDAAMLLVQLDEAQIEIARATRDAQNTRDAMAALRNALATHVHTPLQALVRNVGVGREDVANGRVSVEEQREHWARVEEAATQMLTALDGMLGQRSKSES